MKLRLKPTTYPATLLFGVATALASCAVETPIVDLGQDPVEDAGGGSFVGAVDASAGVDASATEPERVLACLGTECPWPYATCPGSSPFSYKCEVNVLTDNANCGACGNVCPTFDELHVTTQCIDGSCQSQCIFTQTQTTQDFQNCNGLIDDGCEINIATDVDNCGACGNKCPENAEGARLCRNHVCGCPAGQIYCGDAGCRDIMSDNNNCGACGNVCPAPDGGAPWPNTEYNCQQGVCNQLACSPDWADCNGLLDSDGCEIHTASDPNNCGACGNRCTPDQICLVTPIGPRCACASNETLCENDGQFSCADLLTNPNNCGACGVVCPIPVGNADRHHARANCEKGFCGIECLPGWGDCDADPNNGCETDVLHSPRHCGACGNLCDTAAGQPCIDGECLMVECDAGPVTR